MDRFYTPSHLAESLVRHSQIGETRLLIADFAVGDGELLRAASSRWPQAKFLGNDINPRTVNRLSQRHPSWSVIRCNFLDAQQRNALTELRSSIGLVSLVLLNPPFSNRGARRQKVEVNGHQTTCSLGLAFLATALPYLTVNGELLAILPAGTLYSEMDGDAWRIIDRFFSRLILKSNGDRTFRNCLAKTVVVKLIRRPVAKSEDLGKTRRLLRSMRVACEPVTIERGRVDMPSLNGALIRVPVPLVHTTELKNHRVNLTSRFIDASRATIQSYAVLLPRVGRPTRGKICLHSEGTPIAISNCVIAVKCRGLGEAKLIQKALLLGWETTRKAYVGTCAQYVTMQRLRSLLAGLRFRTGEKL